MWAKFGDLSNNPVVFSVVIATLGLYVLLLVWAYRKDRKDLRYVSTSTAGVCWGYRAAGGTKSRGVAGKDTRVVVGKGLFIQDCQGDGRNRSRHTPACVGPWREAS